MGAIRLEARAVAKIWGRNRLPAGFEGLGEEAEPTGEIWFECGTGTLPGLLVKYLFTSERLSVQVHPGSEQARALGYSSGKDEAWLVIAAEPGATIATGLIRHVSAAALRQSALDGSIVDLLDWQEVAAGDCFYAPAGTIHALGAGVSVIEVQQNVDVTYRLFDYGRPRELHLDEAVAAARLAPADCRQQPQPIGPGRTRIATGPALQLERLEGWGIGMVPASSDNPVWLIPCGKGGGLIGGQPLRAGEVWIVTAPEELALSPGAQLIVAAPQAIEADYWTGWSAGGELRPRSASRMRPAPVSAPTIPALAWRSAPASGQSSPAPSAPAPLSAGTDRSAAPDRAPSDPLRKSDRRRRGGRGS